MKIVLQTNLQWSCPRQEGNCQVDAKAKHQLRNGYRALLTNSLPGYKPPMNSTGLQPGKNRGHNPGLESV